jgi:serine/threonine protein kinase
MTTAKTSSSTSTTAAAAAAITAATAATASSATSISTLEYLPEAVAQKIVKYAHRRIRESNIKEFVEARRRPSTKLKHVQHDEVEIGELLGKGSFSSVYEIKSIRKKPTETLVLKMLQPKLLDKPNLFAACACDLVKEGMMLATLSHPNILSFRACTPNGADSYASGYHDAFFLVLDRLEETLKDKLTVWRKQQKKGLFLWKNKHERRLQKSLMERSHVILELAEAATYLHSQRILHRDLKPDNIGFDHDGVLKVFDFDVARILPESSLSDDSNATFKLTRRVGSPRYMSPECARGDQYNAKADVYTFGVLCYELMSLVKPYSDMSSEQHDALVFWEGVRPQCPTNWPIEIRSLLCSCWSEDLQFRPTMKEAQAILQKELPKMLFAKKSQSRQRKHSRAKQEGAEFSHPGVSQAELQAVAPIGIYEQQ